LLTAFRRRRSCALVAQLLDPRADRSEIVGGARLGHASSMEEITTGKIVPRGTPPTKLRDPQTKRAGRRDSARLGVMSWYGLSTEGSARRRRWRGSGPCVRILELVFRHLLQLLLTAVERQPVVVGLDIAQRDGDVFPAHSEE